MDFSLSIKILDTFWKDQLKVRFCNGIWIGKWITETAGKERILTRTELDQIRISDRDNESGKELIWIFDTTRKNLG